MVFWCVKIEEKEKKLVRKEYTRQEERKKELVVV
jgi:hypothetical protein